MSSKRSAGQPVASSLSQREKLDYISRDDSSLHMNRELEEFKDFCELELRDELLRGIFGHGFEHPSPIQRLAIKPMIDGNDILAQAQSGTGKTGAFTIASLQVIDTNLRKPQVLQLSPTRELAKQTFDVASELGRWIDGLKVLKVVGGRRRRDDLEGLSKGPQFVVGTPGRVLDMIQNHSHAFPTDYLKILCLDEADEMLSRGFKDAIFDIGEYLPQNIQVCLFSATMPEDVRRLTGTLLRNPVEILVKSGQLTLDGIAQYYIYLDHEDWKFETLCDLYEDVSISQAIIFANSKQRVERLASLFNDRHFTVSFIHGGLTQDVRSLRMKEFKAGATRVMISTELLARGIDCQEVQVVINYDLPRDSENYIHRIGRSGRFGRKGVALNFVTPQDEHIIHNLQQFYQTTIEELPQDVHAIF